VNHSFLKKLPGNVLFQKGEREKMSPWRYDTSERESESLERWTESYDNSCMPREVQSRQN
jgi:hypothetical protein